MPKPAPMACKFWRCQKRSTSSCRSFSGSVERGVDDRRRLLPEVVGLGAGRSGRSHVHGKLFPFPAAGFAAHRIDRTAHRGAVKPRGKRLAVTHRLRPARKRGKDHLHDVLGRGSITIHNTQRSRIHKPGVPLGQLPKGPLTARGGEVLEVMAGFVGGHGICA